MLIFGIMDIEEKRDRNYAIGVICFALILGLGSLWVGWWIIPIALLIMLYVWNWRWALVITLAFVWVMMDFSLSL